MKAFLMAVLMALSTSAFADYTKISNQYVEAQGLRYAYRTLGVEGGVPLVLLQHWTGTMDNWDNELIDLLAKNHKLYIIDNSGIGASQGIVPDNVQQMAKDAVSIIEALKLKKIDLLGFSLGGFIAQQILLDRPELVRKAILVGTGPQGGEGINQLGKVVAETVERVKNKKIPLQAALFFSESEKGTKAGLEFLKRIQNHTVDPEPISSDKIREAQFKAIIKWGSDPSQAAALRKVEQAVLIVNGSNDIMVPTINSYNMFQNFPNAYLILYPDSGHGAFFEYRHVFAAQVKDFLRI